MDRGVQKVRQSIKDRKKNRIRPGLKTKDSLSFTANEEEKHGFFESPAYDISTSFKNNKRKTFPMQVFAKGIASIGLFIAILFIMQTNGAYLNDIKQ